MQKILGYVIGFLTWFIRLVTFIGDVTIWFIKFFVRGILGSFRKLNLDFRKTAPVRQAYQVIHSPLISQDRSFKVGIAMILAILVGVWYMTRDLPSPKALEDRQVPQTTKIYDRGGKLLFNVYTDENRTLVPLSEIPDNLKHATIAIEDKDFYKHKGFDIYGIVRAAKVNVLGGSLQGGSTITQQLVKSAFLTPDRTVTRKVKELYLAFRVEMAFSKDRILEMYLNQVPYGGTAWGVSAAAEQYFGKSVKDLTLAEAALLAGLPQAPSYYSPFGQDPQRAKDRQKTVLARMVDSHYITRDQAEQAAAEDIKFQASIVDIRAAHFVMYVREYLAEKYGESIAAQGGLKVTTTLDLDIQEDAQKIVADNIAKLKPLNVGNGAAVVTKPKTGEILAMVGSKDFFDVEGDGNVNVTIALRQPGSSIKPINYATALEHKLITAATVIMDAPTTFSGGPKPYRPVNYDGRFHGPVQVRYALGNSFNIPAVKVLALNGVVEMIKMAREMGITSFQDESRYGLSLTLGGGEVKMTEMAIAFGVFANEGVRIDLTPVLKVEDSKGRVLEEFKQKTGKRVLTPETSFLISSILSDNSARTAAFGPSSQLVIRGKNVAVKTGTTDDKRDNWTIGYTPTYLVASWVGNNDNKPMNQNLASGVTGA
ncbi:MAG: PBP1A family penicillin-binding protein, partial [Candidatus Curtissbacteria bacterium]|nr:PBP1A family penicillin-binding protein [Candidatus Curtissbacteria bacterium]